MKIFTALRSSLFAFLWSGQTISRLGDHLYRVALAWWVLQKTGSATAMGTVLVFTTLPMLLFVLIGGVAVDRFPRGLVMFLSDLGRGFTVTFIAVLAFSNTLEIWHIYAASILFGFVSAFFQPAYTAIVPDIVPLENRPSANSLTALTGPLTGILGPAIGAVIVAFNGTAAAFALDAGSFFVSALCLVPILRVQNVKPDAARVRMNPFLEFREGWSTVISLPWLWLTILLGALMNLTQAGPYSVAVPFMVQEHLNNDVQALGWLYSAASLGSVLAAIWLGRQTRLSRRGIYGYVGLALWGISMSVLGLPLGLPLLLVASFVVGAALNVFNLIWTNTLQEMVPHELLGRVSSIDYLGSFVLLPIGFGFAGWATDWFGASNVLIVGGALTALLALVGLAQPSIRNLD